MKFQIVWRNQNPDMHVHRRRAINQPLSPSVYRLEELICDGDDSRWTAISVLEVLCGGRVA